MKYGILSDVERETNLNALRSAIRCVGEGDSEGALRGLNFAIKGFLGMHYPIALKQFEVHQTEGKSDEMMAALTAIVETAKTMDCKILIVTKRLTTEELKEIEEDDIEGL
jgi:hypothetical protein